VAGSGEYIVYLQCWDFGGRTRLVATHPTDPAVSAELWIPKGSGANGIGSAWPPDSGQVRLDPNADIDAIVFDKPGHYAPTGDDFNNLEEYRGILYTPTVGGVLTHKRLDPYRKDLFLRTEGFDAEYPFAIGDALNNAGVDVHDTTAWGHDATADFKFFRYHRKGRITGLSADHYTANGSLTGWSILWPELEWQFKLDGDPDSAWTSIAKWPAVGSLVLDRPYPGGTAGTYAVRKSMPHINVLVVRFDREKIGVFENENGRIIFLGASPPNPGNPKGSRFWAWTTKGLARDSKQAASYGVAEAFKIPLDHYFGDKPYAKTSAWDPATRVWETPPGDMKLMPLSLSEDPLDAMQPIDGFHDLGLLILIGNQPNGTWDGDRRLEDYGQWDSAGQMSPFDINGNGYVELPMAQDPNAGIDSNEKDAHGNYYSKARVLKHSITHEICHVLAKTPWHSFNGNCVMYKYSSNWKRDDFLCDEYREMLQIHNKRR
jgi:hypothetical protein